MIYQLIKLSEKLDNSGLSKESEELEKIAAKMILKRAGSIPAGMHRYILNSGLFGDSEYDELEWIRRESEKGIKKLLENHRRKTAQLEGDWNIESEERMLDPQRQEEEEAAWEDLQKERERAEEDKVFREHSSGVGWDMPTKQFPEVDIEYRQIIDEFKWLFEPNSASTFGLSITTSFWNDQIAFGDSGSQILDDTIKELERIKELRSGHGPQDKEIKREIQRLNTKIRSNKKKLSKLNLLGFVRRNIDKLRGIVSKYGRPTAYLGSGSYGDAWILDSQLVLKLTELDTSRIYKHELKALYENTNMPENELMVHAYGKLSHNIHWVVMEKLTNLDELQDSGVEIKRPLGMLIDSILSKLEVYEDELKRIRDNSADMNGYLSMDEETKKLVSQMASRVMKELAEDFGPYIFMIKKFLPDLVDSWYRILVIDMIIKFMTGRTDMYDANIGIRNIPDQNGDLRKFFVFFDPTSSVSGIL